MSPQRFDELVSDALDLIPPELAAAIDNVVILVEDRDPEEPDLLGLYHGVALTERDSWYAGSLPDTITIYRDALLEVCEDEAEVVDEVAITVIQHRRRPATRIGLGLTAREDAKCPDTPRK